MLRFFSTAIGLCLLATGASGAVLKTVYTGTQTMGTAVTNVALAPAVVPTNTFVICQGDSGALGSNPTIRATCELNVAGNQLTITTSAADATITVRWYVVEFLSGVSVQRNPVGIPATLPIGTNTLAVPVALVTLASSFVLITERMNSANQAIDEQWTVRAQLTTTTNLQLTRNASATAAVSVAWQVIQIDSAAVQAGTATILAAALTATAALAPSVDTNRTFLVFSRSAGSATGGVEQLYQVTGQITAPNQITFTRAVGGGANTQVDIVWYAVRMTDGTTVQKNVCGPSGTGAGSDTMPAVPAGCLTIPTAIATNRSIALLSTLGDNPSASTTADLDDTSWRSTLAAAAITLNRSAGASRTENATVAWQVVQFNNTINTIDRVEVVP